MHNTSLSFHTGALGSKTCQPLATWSVLDSVLPLYFQSQDTESWKERLAIRFRSSPSFLPWRHQNGGPRNNPLGIHTSSEMINKDRWAGSTAHSPWLSVNQDGAAWFGKGTEAIIFHKNVTLPSLAQGTFLITWNSLDFLLIDSQRPDV